MTGAQGIAGAVGQVADYFKKQKESKNLATMGLKIAEAAKIMDPAQAPYYDNIINTLKDENTPVDVRGALGAQVQDLLKQNTSMRAVAVQERQMGMRPAYFGGGQSPARSGGYGGSASSGYAPSVDMSRGDAAMANQPGAIDLPAGPDDFILPGESGSDVFSIQQKIQRAQQLNIPAEKINYIVSGVKSALSNPSETSQSTVQSFDKNLSSLIANAERNFEPAKDAKGQPQVVISVDEAGNESRFTKTKGGNLVNEYGEMLTPQGQPISQPQYNQLDVESINRALNMDTGLLPPLPEEELPPTSMTQPIGTPEEQARVQRMVQEGQGRAMVQNMPQGAVATDQSLAYQTPQPQPEQKSAGLGIMAKESQLKQAQSSGEELRKLTELAPRKAKLYEAALNQAYQDPKTAPSQDVVDEAKLQLLMQPESKGPQVMSEDEYNQRNVALINKAQKRVGDRSAAEVILSHFDVIQQLANHPEGSQVFGKSIPESKLRELASTEGSVLALYNNLKGRDLVQAMRDIKAQSGTAAGMSEKETMALQRAVNELDRAQDWKSAQKTLMRISSGAIRAGKKLGLDEGVFEVMPMTPATFDAKGNKITEASKRQTTKAAEILDNPESVPMFRDEVQYFNRVNNLKSRLQGGQGAGTTQPAPQAQPQSQPFAVTPMGLESVFFPKRQPQ
jgi:hypothetical protein